MLSIAGVRGTMSKWGAALRLIGIGWYIALSILLPLFLGLWLDDKYDTGVLFTLMGLGLGILLAFWGLYRMLLPFIEGKQNKEKD